MLVWGSRWIRYTVHRDTHTMTKKVAAAPCSKTAWAKKLKTGKLAAKQSRSKSCGLFSVGALQQMVCRYKISDIDQLKRVLIDCWAQLRQNMLNRAIDQLPKRLMMVIKVKGAHVKFRLD